MSRNNQRNSLKKCKQVARKARRIAHDAMKKVKKTQFKRIIEGRTNVLCSSSSSSSNSKFKYNRVKWINNELVIKTGVAMCATALVNIITGGAIVEVARAGVSVALSTGIFNCIYDKNKEKRRRKNRIDLELDKAKRGHSYSRSYSSLGRGEKTTLCNNEAVDMTYGSHLGTIKKKS